MKKILIILYLIVGNCYAIRSQSIIDYEFLNSAIKLLQNEIGRDSLKLINEVYSFTVKEYEFEYYKNELGEIINEDIIREMLSCASLTGVKMKFNQRKFKSVRLINRRAERRIEKRYYRNFKLAKSKWEKFYHVDTLDKAEKFNFYFNDSVQRKPFMEFDFRTTKNDYVYGITLPCMDSKKEFALISFGGGRIRSHFSGFVYLFRKIEGKWILVKKTNSWSV